MKTSARVLSAGMLVCGITLTGCNLNEPQGNSDTNVVGEQESITLSAAKISEIDAAIESGNCSEIEILVAELGAVDDPVVQETLIREFVRQCYAELKASIEADDVPESRESWTCEDILNFSERTDDPEKQAELRERYHHCLTRADDAGELEVIREDGTVDRDHTCDEIREMISQTDDPERQAALKERYHQCVDGQQETVTREEVTVDRDPTCDEIRMMMSQTDDPERLAILREKYDQCLNRQEGTVTREEVTVDPDADCDEIRVMMSHTDDPERLAELREKYALCLNGQTVETTREDGTVDSVRETDR